MTVTRESLLAAASGFKVESVEVIGVGKMHVKQPSLSDMNWRANESLRRPDMVGAMLLSISICDEQGVLLFSRNDVDEVGNLPYSITESLTEKVASMLGVNLPQVPLDDAAKN